MPCPMTSQNIDLDSDFSIPSANIEDLLFAEDEPEAFNLDLVTDDSPPLYPKANITLSLQATMMQLAF